MVRAEALFPVILRRLVQTRNAYETYEATVDDGSQDDFSRGQHVAYKNVFQDLTGMEWNAIDSLTTMLRHCFK